MTKEVIQQYLDELEHHLLNQSEKKSIELNSFWVSQFSDKAAVYILWEDDEVVYAGETGSLKGRMNDLLTTQNHTVRRNLGKAHFSGHPNFEKASSSKSYPDEIENLLNELIAKHLTLSFILVDLGRMELKERIFAKLEPKYSLKGKRGTKKTYTKAEKQQANKNAYERWTAEDDEKLELLFCEEKTVKELMDIFARNKGAIESRIKKLELMEKYNR